MSGSAARPGWARVGMAQRTVGAKTVRVDPPSRSSAPIQPSSTKPPAASGSSASSRAVGRNRRTSHSPSGCSRRRGLQAGGGQQVGGGGVEEGAGRARYLDHRRPLVEGIDRHLVGGRLVGGRRVEPHVEAEEVAQRLVDRRVGGGELGAVGQADAHDRRRRRCGRPPRAARRSAWPTGPGPCRSGAARSAGRRRARPGAGRRRRPARPAST